MGIAAAVFLLTQIGLIIAKVLSVLTVSWILVMLPTIVFLVLFALLLYNLPQT